VVIIGIHQGHRFEQDDELAQYAGYLQWCIHAATQGQLLTPSMNFMNCSRLVYQLAACRHGLFAPTCADSHIYVNCRAWDQWHAWILAPRRHSPKVVRE
jgi:hypothetical protein